MNFFDKLRQKRIKEAKPPHPDTVYYCSNPKCPNKGEQLMKPPAKMIGKMSVCEHCLGFKPEIEKGSGKVYKRRPFKTFVVKGYR